MQAPAHPIWHDDSYWETKDAARRRAHVLREQAVAAWWSLVAAALRRWRLSQRDKPPARVVLCD